MECATPGSGYANLAGFPNHMNGPMMRWRTRTGGGAGVLTNLGVISAVVNRPPWNSWPSYSYSYHGGYLGHGWDGSSRAADGACSGDVGTRRAGTVRALRHRGTSAVEIAPHALLHGEWLRAHLYQTHVLQSTREVAAHLTWLRC
ncbi:uncharacterized protein UV8b_01011 [Ustilaginoidea virens]|uniref:Uncharacterized protein n=1 Tax=Ustilaginoidea virens TaxID=1159556 RepID=A0A8E5HK75_USTVR|nr:uncharacterized protein UV8b_01011 [Ustilaginoidea virens]QUC16770.1 hypothetical protein UV8b_01011 [Ustilaginoidea virens]